MSVKLPHELRKKRLEMIYFGMPKDQRHGRAGRTCLARCFYEVIPDSHSISEQEMEKTVTGLTGRVKEYPYIRYKP